MDPDPENNRAIIRLLIHLQALEFTFHYASDSMSLSWIEIRNKDKNHNNLVAEGDEKLLLEDPRLSDDYLRKWLRIPKHPLFSPKRDFSPWTDAILCQPCHNPTLDEIQLVKTILYPILLPCAHIVIQYLLFARNAHVLEYLLFD
jgi:hypothetical protein